MTLPLCIRVVDWSPKTAMQPIWKMMEGGGPAINDR